jgi:hypothetical protein
MSGCGYGGGNLASISSRNGNYRAQIVTLGDRDYPVLLDLQTRGYSVLGAEERGHAVARLSLDDALHLQDALADAITLAAYDASSKHIQTAAWGGRSRLSRRVRP